MPLAYVARPYEEVREQLTTEGRDFQTEMTRPTRDFFKVDERHLYVVRERERADGTLVLTLAASLESSI